MRKLVSTLAALALAFAGVLVTGGPAAAAEPALRFHGTQYDSPGTDTRSAASLNAEWISLINTGGTAVNLKGYTIRDKSNHVYKFGAVKIAAKGGRVWLHTGKGTATARTVYWGSGNYIWNNTGDTAYLRNAAGRTLDTCSWTSKANRTYVAC
jgi:hypothetical protein